MAGRYDSRAGTVTVTVPGNVLFDPGKADLKPSSQSTLNKITAAIRKSYPGKRVYVDGHTDSDPINRTREKWQDNLELSFARAASVARYLESKGISSTKVVVRAYGANNPKEIIQGRMGWALNYETTKPGSILVVWEVS